MKIVKQLFAISRWRPIMAVSVGTSIGLIIFIMYISNATSYLSDDPKTCVNCHVMNPQYATWFHSSHRDAATCNDCHVPHDNVFNTYYFKAMDGLRHAGIFTLHAEPQVIFIREPGQKVVQQNCIRCHENVLQDNGMALVDPVFNMHRTDRQCWECHRETPHGRVNSLSSAPNAQIPGLESPVPQWLIEITNNK